MASATATASTTNTSTVSNLQVNTSKFCESVKRGAKFALSMAAHVIAGVAVFNLMLHAHALLWAFLCGYTIYRVYKHGVESYDNYKKLTP